MKNLAEAQLSVRATIVRVVDDPPFVELDSPSESAPFTLQLSSALARSLGSLVHREVDVVAVVHRSEAGEIQGGRLDSFDAVDDRLALSAWRRWYVENASDWDAVVDVEAALGRGSR
jgi:hypothetical protein